jgi:hypothetical protein
MGKLVFTLIGVLYLVPSTFLAEASPRRLAESAYPNRPFLSKLNEIALALIEVRPDPAKARAIAIELDEASCGVLGFSDVGKRDEIVIDPLQFQGHPHLGLRRLLMKGLGSLHSNQKLPLSPESMLGKKFLSPPSSEDTSDAESALVKIIASPLSETTEEDDLGQMALRRAAAFVLGKFGVSTVEHLWDLEAAAKQGETDETFMIFVSRALVASLPTIEKFFSETEARLSLFHWFISREAAGEEHRKLIARHFFSCTPRDQWAHQTG